MKGDFTRWTFDPSEQFTRVLQQQGRVQLDADWNEQAAIHLHFLRTLAEDLIGPFGAPPNADGTPGDGFRLEIVVDEQGRPEPKRFRLRRGRYYVGGLPAENPRDRTYGGVEDPRLPGMGEAGTYLIYLDVWEQFLTYVQEDRIREVALGGVDTAARARLAWQVRALEQPATFKTCRQVRKEWPRIVERRQPTHRGRLRAQARRVQASDDPCIAAPEARYTGENQLYRVEIHRGGTAADGATFKWSRENGSVVFPVRSWTVSADRKTTVVTLEHLGRDRRFSLEKGNWVEALDDDPEEGGQRPLLLVDAVETDRRQVTLLGEVGSEVDPAKHPYLRRWDQAAAAPAAGIPIKEGGWLDLEDGIQVSFEPAADKPAHFYLPGDYWLIPARSATGDVEWPVKKLPDGQEVPKSLPPFGVEHRFAPLGLVTISDGKVTVTDCRRTFGARALLLDTGRAEWSLETAPPPTAVVVEEPDPDWSQALLPARWISTEAKPTKQPPGTKYIFKLRFDLGRSPRGAVLSLRLLADNAAIVKLNGKEIGRHQGYTGPPTPIENEADLIAEANELVVEVTNAATTPRPIGLVLAGQVEVDGRLCCE